MEAQFHKIISGDDHRLWACLVRPILAAASAPYRLATAARNRLYDAGVLRSHAVGAPVVSVGNITLGGTGKTPMVEYVCRWFLDRGKRPVILSRGYGAVGGPNDEARVLATNLPDVPHLQGKDRVALARQAVEQFHPDVLVLDDGFQHRRLARELDIVLIDCTLPFGCDRLFPRGLLREPVANLSRADLIVLTRADHCDGDVLDQIRRRVEQVASNRPIALAEHRPIALVTADGHEAPCGELADKSVVAFCGIGNPAAFWQTVRGLGCRLIDTRTFADHHRYDPADLRLLADWARSLRPDLVLTTQKDMVKLTTSDLGGRPLWAVRIGAALRESPDIVDRSLQAVLSPRPHHARAA